MSIRIDIEKIVPANCPLGYDDCIACGCFELAHDEVICHAETEEEPTCPYCYDTDSIESKNGLHRCLGCGNEF